MGPKKIRDLAPGTVVMAKRDMDPAGSNVRKGTLGIVYLPANHYGDDCGPMVRWVTLGNNNVYDDDVIVVN